MYYKSNISKTEKKIRGEKNKLGHIILSIIQAQQNLEPWTSQSHLSALCSPLWSHGVLYDRSDICTSSTWMCASSSWDVSTSFPDSSS